MATAAPAHRRRPPALAQMNVLAALAVSLAAGCASSGGSALPGLDAFNSLDAACYDRSVQPQTSVVDAHVHFRPFGGPAIPFDEVIGYMRDTGVRFVNVYGIGQTLPSSSSCTYYLDCLGTPVVSSLRNDFVNAANLAANPPQGIHVTLAMTFPDMAEPETVLHGMELLDREFPGMFRWMGEVNVVKQALFGNGHTVVPSEAIAEWAPFMTTLRERGIPLAVHLDIGNDEEPLKYLPLMEEVLSLYPDNKIVWVHMGLSLQLKLMPAVEHVPVMRSMLDLHPNLMLDIAWRVLEDHYFSKAEHQPEYVAFLNEYSDRILTGTDFLASRNKDFAVYKEELEATSRINRRLNDEAFRNIALGQNYFRLMDLNYQAPPVCAAP